ncbi:zinc finger protein CONSTANS-like [Impatiens glandulifera]|uniref:zinc finger protein CONSTANS-like n=1 Tax=Impatiens glandulifera TaxID=253017 RepID=UPI001FB131BF|nr:zinc finger protein CONSTANS-like [Impatiens glandulifera]
MSKCELCKETATIHCDSDEAMLCWNCDATVHSANFLVARHLRNLLCHVCHSPTPWNASGSSLNPGISICTRCFTGCHPTKLRRFRLQNEYIDKLPIHEEEEEDHELITTTTEDEVPPPPPLEDSSSEGSSKRFRNSDRADHNSLKRMRVNNPDLKSDDDDDDDCTSSCLRGFNEFSSRALKLQRVETYKEGSKSRETSIEEQQKELKIAPDHDDDDQAPVTNDGGFWKRRRNGGTVDLIDSSSC